MKKVINSCYNNLGILTYNIDLDMSDIENIYDWNYMQRVYRRDVKINNLIELHRIKEINS